MKCLFLVSDFVKKKKNPKICNKRDTYTWMFLFLSHDAFFDI